MSGSEKGVGKKKAASGFLMMMLNRNAALVFDIKISSHLSLSW